MCQCAPVQLQSPLPTLGSHCNVMWLDMLLIQVCDCCNLTVFITPDHFCAVKVCSFPAVQEMYLFRIVISISCHACSYVTDRNFITSMSIHTNLFHCVDEHLAS